MHIHKHRNLHAYMHIPLYHEGFVEKVVVGKHTHRGVERILTVTRCDNTRSVVLTGSWSATQNLISFPLDPTSHLIVKPHKLIELVISLISGQYTRRDKTVKQGLYDRV